MKLLSFESLKVFCDVVREKSFSRGAAVNEVSQSAASQAVLQIERRLGVRLIDRSKRPFSLTPEGKAYYEECRDILDRYLSLETRIRLRPKGAATRVTVACIYSVVLCDLDRYVQRFLKDFPDGAVRFRYLHPDDVHDSVVNEQADLGLLSFPRRAREIRALPWRDEPMVLVCPPKHRFASAAQVTLDQLNGEKFVAFESGLAIRRHVDQFLRRNKIRVRTVMEFDNIEFIKRGVETGAGVSILPEPTVRNELVQGSLRVAPMPRFDLVRSMSIIYRASRVLTPAMQDFIKVLRLWPQGPLGNGE